MPPPSSRRWSELLLIGALTFLFTAFMLQYSRQNYRLRIEPYYDDIGYFTDGYERLITLDQQGIAGAFRSLLASPPHSLWSTLLAMTAFATLGVTNFAPYAANGILVLVLLLVLSHLGGEAELQAKLMVALFSLSAPMVALGVLEFRPDFAANLFLAAGTALIFFSANPAAGLGRRRCIAVALFFSGALLAKPTTVLATLFLILSALGLHVGLASRDRSQVKARIKDAAWVTGLVALLAGWYYALGFQQFYQYISANLTGSIYRDLNKIHSLGDRLAFFLTGVGGIQLGKHYAYLLGLATVSAGVAAIQHTPAILRAYLQAFLWIAAAYLGTSLVGIANHFIGLNFQIMLLLTGAFAFHHLLAAGRVRAMTIPVHLAALALVVVAAITGFPPRHGRFSPGEADDINLINERLVSRLASLTAGKPVQTVTFLTIGLNANPETFHWLLMREHLQVNTRADMIPANLRALLDVIDSSDIVIASDMNVPALITNTGSAAAYPYVAFLPAAMDFLNTSGHFRLESTIRTATGGCYYLYQKQAGKP